MDIPIALHTPQMNLCPAAISNHRTDHPHHNSALDLHKLFLKISQPKLWSKWNEEAQHPPVHGIGIKEMLVEISTFPWIIWIEQARCLDFCVWLPRLMALVVRHEAFFIKGHRLFFFYSVRKWFSCRKTKSACFINKCWRKCSSFTVLPQGFYNMRIWHLLIGHLRVGGCGNPDSLSAFYLYHMILLWVFKPCKV